MESFKKLFALINKWIILAFVIPLVMLRVSNQFFGLKNHKGRSLSSTTFELEVSFKLLKKYGLNFLATRTGPLGPVLTNSL